jgi:hypothetical protein
MTDDVPIGGFFRLDHVTSRRFFCKECHEEITHFARKSRDVIEAVCFGRCSTEFMVPSVTYYVESK